MVLVSLEAWSETRVSGIHEGKLSTKLWVSRLCSNVQGRVLWPWSMGWPFDKVWCKVSFIKDLYCNTYQLTWVSSFLTARRRRAVLAGGLVFFFVLSVTNPKPLQMMSSSANDRPFLSSFRHIPPQESFVQLANLTIQIKNGRRGERLIWSNLG